MSDEVIFQPRHLIDPGGDPPRESGGAPKLHGRATRAIRRRIGEVFHEADLSAAERRAVQEHRDREGLRPAFFEAMKRRQAADSDVLAAERELDRRVLALLLEEGTEEHVLGASEELDAARRRLGWFQRAELELGQRVKVRGIASDGSAA